MILLPTFTRLMENGYGLWRKRSAMITRPSSARRRRGGRVRALRGGDSRALGETVARFRAPELLRGSRGQLRVGALGLADGSSITSMSGSTP